jgi:hypothetical protein
LILAGDGIIIGRTRWCAGENEMKKEKGKKV